MDQKRDQFYKHNKEKTLKKKTSLDLNQKKKEQDFQKIYKKKKRKNQIIKSTRQKNQWNWISTEIKKSFER